MSGIWMSQAHLPMLLCPCRQSVPCSGIDRPVSSIGGPFSDHGPGRRTLDNIMTERSILMISLRWIMPSKEPKIPNLTLIFQCQVFADQSVLSLTLANVALLSCDLSVVLQPVEARGEPLAMTLFRSARSRLLRL